jgi:hypothetical protein
MHAARFYHGDENAHVVQFETLFDALDIIHDSHPSLISKWISPDRTIALLACIGVRYSPGVPVAIIAESH